MERWYVLAHRVRVLVSVGVAVVSTVVAGPPSDGTLNSTSADEGEENLERRGGLVGSVGPETVVAGSDAETGPVVVEDRPQQRLEGQRSPESGDAAHQRDAADEEDVEPVDVLVPVLAGHGIFGDVLLGRVVLGVAVGLRGLRHSGGLAREELGLNSRLAGGRLVRRHGDSGQRQQLDPGVVASREMPS